MKRHILTRLCLLALVLAMLLALPGCSKYRTEMSNTRQSEVMLTVGGTEVAYEVVYFFYCTYRDAYPEESFDQRMARVKSSICELYGIFALSKAYEIDPYGDEVNETLGDMVVEMIDSFPTRRDYIARLSDQHMTDAVSRLLLRSYICQELLLSEMEDELEDEELLTAFLGREDVIRVLSMTLDFGDQTEAMRRRAEEIMQALSESEDTDEAFLEIARRKATAENAHSYLTTAQWHSLCGTEGGTPAIGSISEPLYEGTTCLIMRVSEKDLAYAKENPDEIGISYLECAIRDTAATLAATYTPNAAYTALTDGSFV